MASAIERAAASLEIGCHGEARWKRRVSRVVLHLRVGSAGRASRSQPRAYRARLLITASPSSAGAADEPDQAAGFAATAGASAANCGGSSITNMLSS